MLQIEVIGHLAAAATLENVNSSEFISFRLAHTDRVKRSDGSVSESTTWCRVSVPVSRKNVLPYLVKGAQVYVRGRVRFSIYDSKAARTKVVGIDIFANELELCGGGSRSSQQAAACDSGITPQSGSENDVPF